MSPVGFGQDSSEYDALPEAVKLLHTFEEWMWLSEREKAQLVSRETSPPGFEDGP